MAIVNQSSPQMVLATCEPYFSYVHGETDKGKYIVIYEYDLDEFYLNEWKRELSFYKKKLNDKIRNHEHPLIRNYHSIVKKSKMEIVEIVEENNVCYCILHTYKINILKRLWKKYNSWNDSSMN